MAVIGIFNVKGGVGKSSIAVNLAYCSAAISARRTLLWDLDPQGGATHLLGARPDTQARAKAVFKGETEAAALVRPTAVERLDILPADASLSGLDAFLDRLGKRRRMAKLTDALAARYDRIIVDCPPVLNHVSDQVLKAADVIIVPVVPSALSLHALDTVMATLARHHKNHAPVLPVLSMVDRRRASHRAAIEAYPDWPVIAYASVVEKMAAAACPVAMIEPRAPVADTFRQLWTGIERQIAKPPRRRRDTSEN